MASSAGARSPKRRRKPITVGRVLRTVFVYAGMVVALLVILGPFAWLLISSVADKADLLARPLSWIPAHISFQRFVDLTIGGSPGDTQAQEFRSALMNSLVIASMTTLVGMTVGTVAAYAFSRFHFPGRGWMILAFMATTMLPPIALLLPLYQIMNTLGLSDTPLALIIIYSSFVTPYVVWLMRGYLDTIPRDLDDAARVDGCSRLGALWRVILPVSRPGLLSTALLAFLLAWDEFLYALVITQTNASRTLPVALNDFIGRYGTDFGRLATGGVIAAIPPLIIAFVFQRYIVAGLTAGSVKG
ncbi:MAG: carbohydrate ABC transporter permease [Candidatus Limnocylindrales bacterium]